MSEEMLADMARLGQFVADIPLAALNPAPLTITSSDAEVRGWGLAGPAGGLLWVQDFALQGQPIEVVRANETVRQGVELSIEGLAAGDYTIRPYDTWVGEYLETFTVTCVENELCLIPLPDFRADMAFALNGQ
jgi:hypothetical protein